MIHITKLNKEFFYLGGGGIKIDIGYKVFKCIIEWCTCECCLRYHYFFARMIDVWCLVGVPITEPAQIIQLPLYYNFSLTTQNFDKMVKVR